VGIGVRFEHGKRKQSAYRRRNMGRDRCSDSSLPKGTKSYQAAADHATDFEPPGRTPTDEVNLHQYLA